MKNARFVLKCLRYKSQTEDDADLDFEDGLNLIYGASNTGKTFLLKSVDFMLGGSTPPPEIDEIAPFDRLELSLVTPDHKVLILGRAVAGGSFEASTGILGEKNWRLSAKHKADDDRNLSNFLLGLMGLTPRRIAKDASGEKRSLSFRDLAPYAIVDETTIQSEVSPFESGQLMLRTEERSVLKLLLTGQDDSAIVPVVNRKTFRTSKAARLAVIDEMIGRVREELEADYPDIANIEDQDKKIEETFSAVQAQLQEAEAAVSNLLRKKREVAIEISTQTDRLGQIGLNLVRFSQLGAMYKSDIQRLESLEEAAFLLTLGDNMVCPLCGAPPDAQKHKHATDQIQGTKAAALAEIRKIKALDEDLSRTVTILSVERSRVEAALPSLKDALDLVEAEFQKAAPSTTEIRQRLGDVLAVRDQVKHGLELLGQLRDYEELRKEVSAEKEPTASDKPKLGVPGTVAHEYGQVVSRVLQRWHFPGECHVAFDEETYDLRIDGKLRKANGKGVRAVTHAAMKVALLLYCRERNLPHPGFLLLDTPLLTYRDPMTSKAGELSSDEEALARTTLKDHFFDHLLELGQMAQTVVLENIDPSPRVLATAHTIVFSGKPSVGRVGLLPVHS